jgi:hypothetical protein
MLIKFYVGDRYLYFCQYQSEVAVLLLSGMSPPSFFHKMKNQGCHWCYE